MQVLELIEKFEHYTKQSMTQPCQDILALNMITQKLGTDYPQKLIRRAIGNNKVTLVVNLEVLAKNLDSDNIQFLVNCGVEYDSMYHTLVLNLN